ncbi:MAG: xylan 1,4-beta-xylosidase [Clostridia bacterium]|nr:xylan 1,4-beta-xylosidase [Clostridia bacterium]
MFKNERFEKIYSQGRLESTEIWVDKVTGVNYIFHQSGNAGGMTPLLDKNGSVVVSEITESQDF